MEIRFISSLTADDEARVAAALVNTIKNFLDPFPIFYTIRIETSDAHVFQHVHTPSDLESLPASRLEAGGRAASLRRVTAVGAPEA
jgi:hypothetical protein